MIPDYFSSDSLIYDLKSLLHVQIHFQPHQQNIITFWLIDDKSFYWISSSQKNCGLAICHSVGDSFSNLAKQIFHQIKAIDWLKKQSKERNCIYCTHSLVSPLFKCMPGAIIWWVKCQMERKQHQQRECCCCCTSFPYMCASSTPFNVIQHAIKCTTIAHIHAISRAISATATARRWASWDVESCNKHVWICYVQVMLSTRTVHNGYALYGLLYVSVRVMKAHMHQHFMYIGPRDL